MMNNPMDSDSIKRTPTVPLHIVRSVEEVAVLIDAENVDLKLMDQIMAEAESLEKLTFRQVFGKGEELIHWNEVAGKYALELKQTVTAKKGKNGSDIALVIGALTLFHVYNIRRFCIVASDSDYMPLVAHLREKGCEVFLIGNQFTPDLLREACTKFTLIEQSPITQSSQPASEPSQPASIVEDNDALSLERAQAFEQACINAAKQNKSGEWVSLQRLGAELRNNMPRERYNALFARDGLARVVQQHQDLFEFDTQGNDNHPVVRLRKIVSV